VGSKLALVITDDVLKLLVLVVQDLGEIRHLRLGALGSRFSRSRPLLDLPQERFLHVPNTGLGELLLTFLCYRYTTLRIFHLTQQRIKGKQNKTYYQWK
jgi:hypothetical protein